jgi:hypothetical protein
MDSVRGWVKSNWTPSSSMNVQNVCKIHFHIILQYMTLSAKLLFKVRLPLHMLQAFVVEMTDE